MTKEKPRTHRKQDDKYFEGLTKEKALSEKKEHYVHGKGHLYKGEDVAKAVERLKEKIKDFGRENWRLQVQHFVRQGYLDEILDEIFGDLK